MERRESRRRRALAIEVRGLEWDDENIYHCARHRLTPMVADAVLRGRPLFFPNKAGKRRSGTHMMIGPDGWGALWTVVLVRGSYPGGWKPKTGWPSAPSEAALYRTTIAMR